MIKKLKILKAYLSKRRNEWRRKKSLRLFEAYKEENQQKLEALRDIHKGKRCFIVCNGPSLKASDLEKIHQHGEISFACNKIDKIFSQTDWRPTYYTVLDEGYQFSLIDVMRNIPSKMQFYRKESFIYTRNANHDSIWLNCDGNREYLDNPVFSEDASKVVYTIATTTYAMFELAVYMGMRELYLIGCDCSYAREISKDGKIVSTGRKSYFAGSNEKDMQTAASTWEMFKAYEAARKYADAHGIKIYNATRGGKLEAFERVDFDSLF